MPNPPTKSSLPANKLKFKAAINGSRAIYSVEAHPGLYLHVFGDGKASWVLRYRVGKSLKQRVLSNDAGRASFVSIINAKDEIRLAAKTLGIDLWAERQAAAEAKAASEKVSVVTLSTAIDQWIAKPRKRLLRPRTVALYQSTFNSYVVSAFGKRPINAITKVEIREHFAGLKERLLKKGGRATRAEVVGKAHDYLQAVFEFAVDEGYLVASPMRGLPRPVPKEAERKSSRPLRPAELRAVWHGAGEHMSPTFAGIIKLLLLLGRRRAEVAGARKDEFHLEVDNPYWIIPPREGNKSNLSSLAPLSRLSLAIVEDALVDSGTSQFLFPQSRGAEDLATQPDPVSHAWRDLCKTVGVSDEVNLHDARGLMTDALEQMGVPDNIVSHCLHHTSDMKGTTAKRVYSSNQFHAEKRRALRLWELRLRNIVNGKSIHALNWIPRQRR